MKGHLSALKILERKAARRLERFQGLALRAKNSNGITIPQLSALLGCSQSAFYRYMKGERIPPMQVEALLMAIDRGAITIERSFFGDNLYLEDA